MNSGAQKPLRSSSRKITQSNQASPEALTDLKAKKSSLLKESRKSDLGEKYNDPYVNKILVPNGTPDDYDCKICPKRTKIGSKSHKQHLTEGKSHRICIRGSQKKKRMMSLSESESI